MSQAETFAFIEALKTVEFYRLHNNGIDKAKQVNIYSFVHFLVNGLIHFLFYQSLW